MLTLNVTTVTSVDVLWQLMPSVKDSGILNGRSVLINDFLDIHFITK